MGIGRRWVALAGVAAIVVGIAGQSRGEPTAEARARHLRELKRLEMEILFSGARAKLAKLQNTSRKARRTDLATARRGAIRRPARDLTDSRGQQGRLRVPPPSAPRHSIHGPLNQIVNDRSLDVVPGITQSEAAVGARGPSILVAWNDGEGLRSGTDGIGYAYSSDGGVSWHDAGAPPLAGGVARWLSDQVIAVDEKRGDFYLGALVLTNQLRNGIAVVKGRFVAGALQWEAPVVPRSPPDTLPDKPWLAADSSSGSIYLSSTTFSGQAGDYSNHIELQISRDGNQTWTTPIRLSTPVDNGRVQGSRPAVGPDGELRVVWRAVDTTQAGGGRDFLRMRSSLDGGLSFTPEVNVVGYFPNFLSGAPGFNRGFGPDFPAIAIDRSGGPHRGRMYVMWNESINYFRDVLPVTVVRDEQEPDNTSLTATPFKVGDTVLGAIEKRGDIDWFAFDATAGQTVLVYIDSLSESLDAALRVVCSDGSTHLAYSAPLRVRPRLVMLTAPVSGRYYLLVTSHLNTEGVYRMRTGWHVPGNERARDQRDVFSAYSDDGVTWSEPVRANDDPPWYDNWLPEIAVGGEGSVHSLWYDFRDSPRGTCGAGSNVYMARSGDGGDTWSASRPVSDFTTLWSDVFSNLEPNQGDYLGLFADAERVYPVWADGRNGDPDVYVAIQPLATPVLVSLVSVHATAAQVNLTWSAPGARELPVTIERRTESESWTVRAQATVDGGGRIAYQDRDVLAGGRYGYRLVIADPLGPVTAGEVWVDLPLVDLALAIARAGPNPGPGAIDVWVTLPRAMPADVELLDTRGRRLRRYRIDGQAGREAVRVAEPGSLPSGVYLVRVRQDGRSAVAKISLVS
ncbi:MAG TPA: T9SS type A sorting domain-containing protein [Candidatus Limnocylindria bacterium]|nr:T9SS type A sorting domain-containing protein [Candidatus Limnocylindria bacterium]